MIIVLKKDCSEQDVSELESEVESLGYIPHTIHGVVRTVIAAVGDETSHQSLLSMESDPRVERVIAIQKRWKLVSREHSTTTHQINVAGKIIGGDDFHVIAGPCAVENYDQLKKSAQGALDGGATFIRAGAYKPRTSPYDFQGLGAEGLELLSKVKMELGTPIVSEIVKVTDIPAMNEVVDIYQIGTRNALNYALLEAVAETGKPVLLKRGMSATIEEWILAAEYLAKSGNQNIILCERGIRTFETSTRNTLDISAVAVAKQETHLPVFVDPSHAAGRRDIIPQLSKAAAAVGADGILVEVHFAPEEALSDSKQQLSPVMFKELMADLEPFVVAAGKKIAQ
jgi:3-deoxy-7-phosphoheptulonate synthase